MRWKISPAFGNGDRRGGQMEKWKERAEEGVRCGAGTAPSRRPACLPRSRAPHRVVELGDGRHDGVVVLAPVHLRAASLQLVPPVRDAHGHSGALEQLLPQPRRAQSCCGGNPRRQPAATAAL
ncbi:hypothetical protein AAY473_024019 [Plecturocebus cupreus]